eukprot:TRINITY_DN1037_c0_g2_i2.p1 TRINITY_DN1037_c0_g2~~TRINITY_DN1037_c0_g2_i2.p1  ORF type:complete len:1688 (+),score=502.07 TRINITY_DN1037_c0_g2_i2:192-5255(+)
MDLRAIAAFESRIYESQEYNDTSMIDSLGITPISSFVQFLAPTMHERTIYFNGRNETTVITEQRLEAAIHYALKAPEPRWFFSDDLNISSLSCSYLRSEIAIGSPVGGYPNPAISISEQARLVRPKVLELRNKFLKIWSSVEDTHPHGVSLSWGGDFITEDEILEVLITDAMWAIPSLLVILMYCLYHLRSFFLSATAVFLLLLSFPASLTVYLMTGATYIGALNVLSFYIMLGIGVDDIFVFSSTFFFARRPPAPPRVGIAADAFLADNSFRQVSFVDDQDDQHSLVLQFGEDCPYILSWFHSGTAQLERLPRITVNDDVIKLGTWDICVKSPEGAQRDEMWQKMMVLGHFAEIPVEGITRVGWSDAQKKLKKEIQERFCAPTATIDRIEQGVLHADYTAKGTLDAREHTDDGIALDQRLAYTMRTAGSALFVTSATTAIAFLSNFVSSIPAVRAFGELMSILVLMNYLLTVIVFPTALAFWMVYMRGRTMKEILLNMWLLATFNSNKIEFNLIRAALNRGEGIESNPPSTPTLVTGEVAGVEMQPVSPGNVELTIPEDHMFPSEDYMQEYSSPNTPTNTRSHGFMSHMSAHEELDEACRDGQVSHDDTTDSESSESYVGEIIPGEGLAFKVIGLSGALVRKERELSSEPVGDLEIGEIVIVREIWKNRARLIRPIEGWVSLASEQGGSILQRRESSDVLSSYDEHGAELSSDDDEDTLEDSPLIRQLFDKILWKYLKRFSNLLLITMLMTTLISAYIASTLELQDHKPIVFPSWNHIHKYKNQDNIFGSSGKCMTTISTERCSPWYNEPRELKWHLDCAGVLYGKATVDVCGVCGGTGISCLGCDGQINSNKVWICGKCVLDTEVQYCLPSKWLLLELHLPSCEYAVSPAGDFTDYKIEFLIAFIADITTVYREATPAADVDVTDEFHVQEITTCDPSRGVFKVYLQTVHSMNLQYLTRSTLEGSFAATQYVMKQASMQNITISVVSIEQGSSDTTNNVITIPNHSSLNNSDVEPPPDVIRLETFTPSPEVTNARHAVVLAANVGTTILVSFSNIMCAEVLPEDLKAAIAFDIQKYTPKLIDEYNFDCSGSTLSIYLYFSVQLSDDLSSLSFASLQGNLTVDSSPSVEKHPGHVYNNSDIVNDWPISDKHCVNYGGPAVIIDGMKSKRCTSLQDCEKGVCVCKGLLRGTDCTQCDSSCADLGGECTSKGWCQWCDGRVSETVDLFDTLEDPKLRDQCGVCGSASSYHGADSTSFVGGPANSTCKGCDGVVDSGKQFDSCHVCGGTNDCLVSSLILERAVDVYFVWGIDLGHSKGELTGANQYAAYDPKFEPQRDECQRQMLDICNKYKQSDLMIDQYVLQEGAMCFMSEFHEWLVSQDRPFPVPEKDYSETLYRFITSSQETVDKYGSLIGFATVDNKKKVKYIILSFKSSEKVSEGPASLKDNFDWWEAEIDFFNTLNQCGSKGYQTSPSWPSMFLELAALRSLVSSLVISGLAALVVVVAFTCDIWITVQVMITIIGIVMGTLMTMKLGNYRVGPVEAVAFAAVIGLAVDYTVHFAHGWGQYWMYLIKNGHPDTKPSSVIYRIVLDLGTPLLNAALTTIISTCFLFATTIVPLSEFALVLVVSTTWSIFYSVFLFIPFLLSFPPSPWWRGLRSSVRLLVSYVSGGMACAVIGVGAYYHAQTLT